MMALLLKQLKKQPLLILFSLSWFIKIIHSNIGFSPLKVTDPDGYFNSFNYYINHSYYDIISHGSSYLFNTVNYLFYSAFGNVSLAFFTTNLLSEIALIIIGFKIIKVANMKFKSQYVFILYVFYLFNTLDLNDYHHSNNDVFQAVFIGLGVLLLLKQFVSEKFASKYYLGIAILSALCTLIRPTSLVVIVMFGFAIFSIEILNKTKLLVLVKRLSIFIIPLVLLIALFHYPSFKEQGKLGFYNKSTENNNWVQRNYLATKRMQKGELPIHKNSIFRATQFSVVNNYLKENGEASLPKTQSEFLQKDPILSGLIFMYNVVFTFLKGARYYALLLVIPLLYLCFKPVFTTQKSLVYTWLFLISVLCFIPFTLMEYRWYTGFDIIFILAVLSGISFFETTKFKSYIKPILNSSLVLVTFFNILLTFVIGSSY